MPAEPLGHRLLCSLPDGVMSRRGSSTYLTPDHAVQDGGFLQRTAKEKYKEASEKLFAKPAARDPSAVPGDMPDNHIGSV